MAKSLSVTRKNSSGHIAILYENVEERMRLLAQYLQEGLDKDELCIVVVSESPDEIIDHLSAFGLDARTAVADDTLRIFDMQQTYLSGGEFISDYMLRNVETFIHDAREAGFTGLRTAGEMSWLHRHLHAQPEAERYELEVNTLAHDHDDFIGLCMYPAPNAFGADILRGMLSTHPQYVYDNRIHKSPHYA
jgi:MEDS: MEthanogen/methylotroph, DcmR Sensory domain